MNATANHHAGVRQVHDLPCPRGLPLLGNLHQLTPSRLHLVLEAWAAELGTPYRFQICGMPVTVWSDAELSRSVMRERPHRYRRYAALESVLAEAGSNGLFSAEGSAWAPQRELVAQALSVLNVKAFFPTLRDIAAQLHERWQRFATSGEVVDMNDELKRYTVDVTSALAFGENPRTLEQERNVVQEHITQIFKTFMRRLNAPFPYWRYMPLPSDWRMARAVREVHRYIQQLMQRTRERMRDVPSDAPRNLLEAMLVQCDMPGSGISDEQVAANVLTLLLAGEDTTAHTLAWTLFYVAQDALLQQRLADDARAVLGSARVCPEYGLLKDLDLFEAACTEASRLRPVSTGQGLEPLEAVCVGGIAMPAGTKMFFLARPPMLDPRNFSQPLSFDPDRWLRSHEASGYVHERRAWIQFGSGPRVCPGRHLASVGMRLVLSMLCKEFSFQLAVDPSDIKEVLAFTMGPSAMPVRLSRRDE